MAKRQPGNPRLQGCVQRIFALLQVSGDVNLCVVAAMHLVYYGASTGPIEVGRRALPKLVALLGRPEVSALNATWAWVVASWFHCLCHDARSCSAAYERVQRLSEEHGLPWVARLAIVNRMWLDLFRFDPVEGRKWVERAELAADPYHPWDLGTLHGARGWLALCEGKPDVALDRGLKAVDVFDEAGSAMQRVNFRILVVIAYFESGQLELARQWAEQMRDIAGAGITSFQLASVLIWEANIALAQGDRNLMLDRLRQALHIGKRSETGFIFYNWCGPWMPRLCSEALAAGVEVEYVRELIREYEYLPPSPFEPLWPWPVRVFTLGEFALMRCGQPVEFGRKAPRRVLAVMKYLIAHGGKAVPLRQLADALWPDAEGDAALKSLGVALARLRKLLGRHDALVVNDESVSIDMQRVWIDVRALEHLIAEADPAASEGDGARASEIAARLLSLYRGEFLASDRDEPWALRPRVRVRARFVRCLAQIGARLEASQRWNLAADCYRRGLEADDVAEEFYQGLMRCHRALAQPAQGIAVFERLRQTLSAALGLEPSPATQRLAQELQAQHSQSVVNR
jgi:DNA-binding SARP family transcriptional activator